MPAITSTVDNINTAFVYAMNIGCVVKTDVGMAVVLDVVRLVGGRFLIKLQPIKRIV